MYFKVARVTAIRRSGVCRDCCCLNATIAIVGLRFGCSCCCCGVPVALGGKKDVMVTKILIKDLLRLLVMPKDCCWSGSAIAVLLSVCHNCHCHHCRIASRLLLIWCSSCTWRDGRVGNALDSRYVDIVDADNVLLRSETNKDNELDCSCN